MTHETVTELLPQFIEKLLDESERKQVELHLQSCAVCNKQLKQHRSLRALEAEIAKEEHQADPALSARVMERIASEQLSWFKTVFQTIDPRIAIPAATAIAAVIALTVGRDNVLVLQESYRELVHETAESEKAAPPSESGLAYKNLAPQSAGAVSSAFNAIGSQIPAGPSELPAASSSSAQPLNAITAPSISVDSLLGSSTEWERFGGKNNLPPNGFASSGAIEKKSSVSRSAANAPVSAPASTKQKDSLEAIGFASAAGARLPPPAPAASQVATIAPSDRKAFDRALGARSPREMPLGVSSLEMSTSDISKAPSRSERQRSSDSQAAMSNTTSALVAGAANIIPPGYRATTVEIDATSGIEGWAAPGTKVDLLLTYRDEKTGQNISQVISQNATVLAQERSTRSSGNQTVTLSVPPPEAIKIFTARKIGKFSLLLQAQSDNRGVGNLFSDIIAGSYPAPQQPQQVDNVVRLRDSATGAVKEYVLHNGKLIERGEFNARYPQNQPQLLPYGSYYQPPQYPTWNAPQEVYGEYEENERTSVSVSPVSTFSFDVDTGSYTNARSFLFRGQLPPPQSVRIEEFLNYFSYGGEYEYQGPFGVNTEIAPSPLDPGKYLLKVAVRTKESARDEDSGWNLVFLVDVSGSMASSDKLGLVKDSLRVLVNKMRPIDRISIVTYANGAQVVLPATTGADKERILSVLSSLSAAGGTNGADGINLAYQVAEQNRTSSGVSRVILVTDGDFNVGNYSFDGLMKLIELKRHSGISLTSVGVGRGDYNEKNLEQLANRGNGNYFYLDSFQEAQRIFSNDLVKTMEVVAQDVKTHVEFNPRFVSEYRLIGYDNRKLTGEEFADESTDAGEVGAGQVTTVLYELSLSFAPTGSNEPLRYQENPVAEINGGAASRELAFVRIRSKQPGGANPGELSFPIQAASVKTLSGAASEDFKFAAAVEYFGHILRQSKYRGSYTVQQVLSLARSSAGSDADGKRSEFVRLIELASSRGLY